MLFRRNLKPLAIPLVNPGEVNLSGNASPLSVDFGYMDFFIVISVNGFQTVHSTSVQDKYKPPASPHAYTCTCTYARVRARKRNCADT